MEFIYGTVGEAEMYRFKSLSKRRQLLIANNTKWVVDFKRNYFLIPFARRRIIDARTEAEKGGKYIHEPDYYLGSYERYFLESRQI